MKFCSWHITKSFFSFHHLIFIYLIFLPNLFSHKVQEWNVAQHDSSLSFFRMLATWQLTSMKKHFPKTYDHQARSPRLSGCFHFPYQKKKKKKECRLLHTIFGINSCLRVCQPARFLTTILSTVVTVILFTCIPYLKQ